MDDDLTKGLLNKKGAQFNKMYEECVVKIQRIKQKNDVIQRQTGTQVEDHIKEQISRQGQYLQKQITDLKNMMQKMENKFKDPQSKNRLKKLKVDAEKQVQRNKIILKDLINSSFVKRSGGRRAQQDQPQKYMQGGKIDYNHINNQKKQKQSLLTDELVEQHINLDIDYDMQRKIVLQKNEMLNEVELKVNRINEIMNDMAVQVDEQGQNIDLIEEQLLKANQNVVDTNQNLDTANTYSKKAKKKYIFLIILILLVLGAAGGVLYIVLS